MDCVQKYEDLLVLSLGTGKTTVRYSAKTTAKWGTLSWIYNKGNVPILDMLLLASEDIVDYNLSNTFYEQCSHDNYLRIQVSTYDQISTHAISHRSCQEWVNCHVPYKNTEIPTFGMCHENENEEVNVFIV